jgi:outer membrane autotransporter protein
VVHDGQVELTPHFDASYLHEFMDGSRGINSDFEGTTAGTFSVSTPTPSRNSGLFTLGLDAKLDSTFTIFSNYTVQAGQSSYFGQAFQAGLKIGF